MKKMNEEQRYELEDCIKKANLLINTMIDAYDMETLIASKNDALAFGIMKHSVYMHLQMVQDYLLKAKKVI